MSMSLDDARNIATILAAIVAAIGVLLAVSSLRAAQHSLLATQMNLRSRVYVDALGLLEGKDAELRDARHLLEAKVRAAKKSGDVFDSTAITDEVEMAKLDGLARAYDKIGLLVKYKTIPLDFLFEFYSRPLTEGWQHLQRHVSRERDARKQRTHMLKFEALAVGAAAYREAKYGKKLPVAFTKEAQDEWESWTPWER